MFDITSEQSFMSIRPWLDQLKLHSYCEKPDMVLCGNKADLDTRRVVSRARAKEEADKHGIPYFETSAASGQNVAKAIDCLLDLVMVRMHKVVESSIPKLINHPNLASDSDKNAFQLGKQAAAKQFTQNASSCTC